MSVPDEDNSWLKNQQASIASLKRADIVAKLRTSWQRLNAPCNGLLSAYCGGSRWRIEEALLYEEAPALLHELKIDFIHRSAKEFLKSKGLTSWTPMRSSVNHAIHFTRYALVFCGLFNA